MKRNIIHIDNDLCNGCGKCAESCLEGAIQMIDGKAQLVSELYCDGLGSCISDCPVGAISIEEKDAEQYDEIAVIDRIIDKGEKVIYSHLKHLYKHGQTNYFKQALNYLTSRGISINEEDVKSVEAKKCSCQGGDGMMINRTNTKGEEIIIVNNSKLNNWPIQLHLINPNSHYFKNTDIVLAADCTAFSYNYFQQHFLQNHLLLIACPKLDSNKESYVQKITDLINISTINTITLVIMEVPCCSGLLQIVNKALINAVRKVPIKKIVISIDGVVISEGWI